MNPGMASSTTRTSFSLPRMWTWAIPLLVLIGTQVAGASPTEVATPTEVAAPIEVAAPTSVATPTDAHTELRQATPEPGEISAPPIEEILLAFTTSVQAPLSQILLFGPNDVPVATGPVHHPPEGSDHLRVELEIPIETGSYRVEWRTVAPDGHVVQGSYSFQVVSEPADDLPTDPPSPDAEALAPSEEARAQSDTAEIGVDPSVEEGMEPALPVSDDGIEDGAGPPGGTVTRWIQLLGTILLLGATSFRFGVLRAFAKGGGLPEARARMRTRLAAFAAIGVALLLVAAPLRLLNQLADLGPEVGWNQISFLLLQTAWGAGWFLHLTVVVLGVVGLLLAAQGSRGDPGWLLMALAALLVPLVSVLQGHAWGVEGARTLAASSLYLHVAGAGIWLGGLIMLILAGIPSLRSTPDLAVQEDRSTHALPALARLVNAFSRIALLSVCLIVLTGVTNSWLIGGGFDGISQTGYGRTLLLKVGVILVAFTLGFYNWRRVRPSLVERPDPGTLRIPASVEAALGIVVLLITAVLVATPPP